MQIIFTGGPSSAPRIAAHPTGIPAQPHLFAEERLDVLRLLNQLELQGVCQFLNRLTEVTIKGYSMPPIAPP